MSSCTASSRRGLRRARDQSLPVLLGCVLAMAVAPPANAAPDCSPRPTPQVLASDQGVLESIASDRHGRLFYTDTDASRLLRLDRPGAQPKVLAGINGILGVMVDRDGSLVVGFDNSSTDALADNGNAGL